MIIVRYNFSQTSHYPIEIDIVVHRILPSVQFKHDRYKDNRTSRINWI